MGKGARHAGAKGGGISRTNKGNHGPRQQGGIAQKPQEGWRIVKLRQRGGIIGVINVQQLGPCRMSGAEFGAHNALGANLISRNARGARYLG
jgi:hypothetical protein